MTPAEFVERQATTRTEATQRCARVCGVTERMVWNWLKGSSPWKPSHEKLLQIYTESTPEQRERWWPQL